MINREQGETYIFNALFEGIRDGAFLVNERGVIADVNAGLLRFLEFSDESDLINKNLFNFIPQRFRNQAFAQFQNLCPASRRTQFQTTLLTKSGNELPAEFACHFLSEDSSGPVLVSCRDIAYHSEIAEAIDLRSQKYLAVMEHSYEGILEINPMGVIFDVNPAYLTLTGYRRDELLALNYFDLLTGGVVHDIRASGRSSFLFYNYHIAKNKSAIGVHVKIIPLKHSIDRLLVFIYPEHFSALLPSSQTSITTKEKIFMEKILKQIKHSQTEPLFIYRTGESIIYANDAFAGALDMEPSEFEGMLLDSLILPEDLESFMQQWSGIFNETTESVQSRLHLFNNKNRLFLADVATSLHRDDAGVELMVVRGKVEPLNQSLRQSNKPDFEKALSAFSTDKSEPVLIGQPGAGFIYANQACCELLGYKMHELKTIKGSALLHPDDFKKYIKIGVKIYTGLQTEITTKGRFLGKDGSTITAEITVTRQKLSENTCFFVQFSKVFEPA